MGVVRAGIVVVSIAGAAACGTLLSEDPPADVPSIDGGSSGSSTSGGGADGAGGISSGGALPGDGGAGSALPHDAVLAFNAASCPGGWQPMDGTHTPLDARGRAIVGAGGSYPFESVGGADNRVLTDDLPYPGVVGYAPECTGLTDAYGFRYGKGCALIPTPEPAPVDLRNPRLALLFCQRSSPTASPIPAKAVISTTRAACPSGFGALDGTNGLPDSRERVIVGTSDTDGGALGATSGAAKQNLVGANLPQYPEVDPAGTDVYCIGQANSTGFPRQKRCDGVVLTFGVPIDIRNPYVPQLQCQAMAAQDTVPSSTIVDFDLSSCPPGWAAVGGAEGRVIVGASTALVAGVAGGRAEAMLDISQLPLGPSHVEQSCTGGPLAGWALAQDCGKVPYVPAHPPKAFAIMNPYLALTRCQKD